MADPERGERRRGRLPPISGDGVEVNNEERPKRRRRPRSSDPGEGQDGVVSERPRRRSRRPRTESSVPSEAGIAEEGDPAGSRTELIPEGDAEAAKPRRKRRKKRRPPPEGEENAAVEDATEDRMIDREYADLAEDIVTDDNMDQTQDPEAGDGVAQREENAEEDRMQFHRMEPTLRSQPVDRMFIEGKSRFRSEDKIKYEQKLQAEKEAVPEKVDEGPQNLTLDFALGVSRIFRGISLLCHGPFAGMAIVHCIFIWHSIGMSVSDFLTNYAPFSRNFTISYYILFVICTVSACVRSDIGRPTRTSCAKCWTMQSGAISVLFYFIGFIINNYMYSTDHLIHIHVSNNTYWNSLPNHSDVLNQWKILDIVRCVAICLGWFVIALTPVDDRLRDNLRAGIEEFLSDDQELVEVKTPKA